MSKKSFLIFCLSFFAISFGVGALAALIPSISITFNTAQVHAAKLVWLYMLPYGIFALFWAPLTRIVSVKKIFLFTTMGFAVATFLFSSSATIHQAFFFKLLMGTFGCSFVPVVLISVGKTISEKNKGKYVGILFALSSISTAAGVFLSGFVYWRTIYLVPALLSFLVFSLALFFLDEFDFRSEGSKVSYQKTFHNRQARRFFIAVILSSFLYHSMQQWFGVYLSNMFSLGQKVISSILFVSTVSAMSFEFLGGMATTRLGGIKVARTGFILMSIFSGLLVVTGQYRFLFLFIALWGSGWALTHVGMSAHLTCFPDRILRDSLSLNSALRFFAGGLGALAGGWVISAVGFKMHFTIMGISAVCLGFYLNRIINPLINERSAQVC